MDDMILKQRTATQILQLCSSCIRNIWQIVGRATQLWYLHISKTSFFRITSKVEVCKALGNSSIL